MLSRFSDSEKWPFTRVRSYGHTWTQNVYPDISEGIKDVYVFAFSSVSTCVLYNISSTRSESEYKSNELALAKLHPDLHLTVYMWLYQYCSLKMEFETLFERYQ